MLRCPPARVLAVVLLLSACAAVVAAQPAAEPAAQRLRSLIFQRDFETAVAEGARLAAAHPNRTDVHAWYVLSLARADRADEAVTMAERMVADAPKDGWSWFALAAALNYQGSKRDAATDAGARAFELMPDDPDAIWIRAQTLANDPKRREEAVAFVDAQRARVKSPAELLNAKAYALYLSSSSPKGGRDEAKVKAAFDTFADARRADPSNVNAHFLAASYLTSLKRGQEAHPLLKQAAALAPASADVHQAYWASIKSLAGVTPAQKNAEIEADLEAFLKHAGRPGVLLAASYAARDLKQPDRQRQFEDRILQAFNDSRQAEWVLIGRMREFRTEEASKTPEYRQLLREYVARPRHHHMGLLGETYRNLFFNLVSDAGATGDELLRVADGMVKHETTNIHITHVAAPIALADKRIHLEKAEQIAREAVAALKKRVERDRDFYKTEREFKEAADRAPAMGHDALGWVLFARGKVDEAEKELLKAYELSPGSRDNLYHLGRFFEAKNEVAKAEEYYVKGLSVQSPGTNPSAAALRALYEKRHGNADGYEAYLDGIRERDRVARKEKIVAARIAAPEPVAGFDLRTLDGTRVTLESLKGKVVVINFWGIWCGWCVREMPDVQKLHEQYAGDPGVAILTINNDSNPDDVPPWMKEKKYTFGVLLDDGYVSKVSVHAFPTTWFLDGQGRKVFEKVGWSEKLLEEFSWRIDAIRQAPGTSGASGYRPSRPTASPAPR